MSSRYIVSVHPADGRGEAVVIEVLREGTHPLDVRLVGCEGESPYVTSSKPTLDAGTHAHTKLIS